MGKIREKWELRRDSENKEERENIGDRENK